MLLIDVVSEIDSLDIESTIYAAKPWSESSRTIVVREPESGELPAEAKELGLKYFLEVSIASDILKDWASTRDTNPTPQQKCARLIKYAATDA